MSNKNLYSTPYKSDTTGANGYCFATVDTIYTGATPDLTWDAAEYVSNGFVSLNRITTNGWTSDQGSDENTVKDLGDATVYVSETNKTDTITIEFMGIDPDAIATWLGASNITALADGFMLGFGGDKAPEISLSIIGKVRSGRYDYFARRLVPSGTISRTFSNTGDPISTSVTFTALTSEHSLDAGFTHIELLSSDTTS